MDQGRVETLLPHVGFGAVRGAATFAANAVEVDIVAHDMGDIDRHLVVSEGCETHPAAAVHHVHGVVDRGGRGRTFHDIVDALAAVEPLHLGHHVGRPPDIDHVIGAELFADL